MDRRDDRRTDRGRSAAQRRAASRRTTCWPRSRCSAPCCCPATRSARSARPGLRPDEFYKPGHQHIFDAIRALYSSGAPVDTITVADELRRAGLLDQVGGTEALHALQNATPAISNAAHYARIVQDTAILRRLIHVAGDIAELAYGEPDDVTKAVDEAESRVFKVAEERVADSTQLLERVDQGGDGPPRGDVRPGRHHHRHRHRLPRRRRAALRAAAVDAEHRRFPAGDGQVRRVGHPDGRHRHRRVGHRRSSWSSAPPPAAC